MKPHPSPVLLPAALAAFHLLTCPGLPAASALIPDDRETLVFERTYTAEHLGKNKAQTVKAMRLQLRRSTDGQRVLARISVWRRDRPGFEYSAGGWAVLPADPECLPVVLDPASSRGRVSVELRKDGAVRVRILDAALFHPLSGPASPPDVAAGSFKLTAEDRENAVFKLDPIVRPPMPRTPR